ncbi:hypothetical protein ATCC90586_011020 [Pythium insidiosum]|nr:hypothetical protein ATCC90586_011020 [Pythium insidiosum]
MLQELALQDAAPLTPDDVLPLSPRPAQEAPAAAASTRASATGRLRPKEEMELLRAQVDELEAELERIKQLQAKAEPPATAAPGSQEAAVWERIAERQQEAKRRAEIENVKLRERLEGQLRLVRSLEKLLRKRPNAALADASCDVLGTGDRKRPRVATTAPHVDPDALYASIRPRLELQRGEVDRLLRATGLDQIESDMDDGLAKLDDATNAIFMEYSVVKVMPFPLATTSDAVWGCLTVPHMELPTGHYSATVEPSGDTARIQFTIGMRQRRTEACVRVYGLGKRYEDDERHVTVWESSAVSW